MGPSAPRVQQRRQELAEQKAEPVVRHSEADGDDEALAQSLEGKLLHRRGSQKQARRRGTRPREREAVEKLPEVTEPPPEYAGAPLTTEEMMERGAGNKGAVTAEAEGAPGLDYAGLAERSRAAAQPRQTAYLVQPTPPSTLDAAPAFSFPGAVALSSLVFVALRLGREQTIADRLDRRALAALADERKRQDAAARQASDGDGLSPAERAEAAAKKARPPACRCPVAHL